MKTRTFLGSINVRIGEYENRVQYLLVANSDKAAWDLLDSQAALYYGEGDEPEEDGGYYANDGEIHVSAFKAVEIGLATFLDLKLSLPVRVDHNVSMPTEADLEGSVQSAAQSLHTALRRKAPELTLSDVLNALASSWGQKNWQVLKAKLDASNAT